MRNSDGLFRIASEIQDCSNLRAMFKNHFIA
jgi:hypothetical protein